MYRILACIFVISISCVNSDELYQPATVYGPPRVKPAEIYGPPTVLYITPTISAPNIKSTPIPINTVYSSPQTKPTIVYEAPAKHLATEYHYSAPRPQQIFTLAYKQPQIHRPVYIAHVPVTYSASATGHATVPSHIYGLSQINEPITFQPSTPSKPSLEYGTPDVKPIVVYTQGSAEAPADPSREYGAPIQVNAPVDVKPILIYSSGHSEASLEHGLPAQVNKPAERYGPPQ